MSTSLQKIIDNIKTTALLPAVGFVSVEEKRVNLNRNADTQLPRMHVVLNDYEFGDLRVDTAEEIYDIDLYILMSHTANPISDLKTIIDNFLKNLFTVNSIFIKLAQQNKIKLKRVDLTNERDKYAEFGGEFAKLNFTISNVNNFGNTPCL